MRILGASPRLRAVVQTSQNHWKPSFSPRTKDALTSPEVHFLQLRDSLVPTGHGLGYQKLSFEPFGRRFLCHNLRQLLGRCTMNPSQAERRRRFSLAKSQHRSQHLKLPQSHRHARWLRSCACIFVLRGAKWPLFIAVLFAASAVFAQTPSLVRDINTIHDTGSSDPAGYLQIGSRTFFSASDPSFGRELWATDGTSNNTVLVKDICSGSCSSNPTNLTNVNGTLFFSVDGVFGPDLWKSDGTPAGTVLVKVLCPTAPTDLGRCDAFNFTNVNGTLFFTLDPNVNCCNFQLWKSDGTDQGTVLVKDMTPSDLTNLNGTLFFSASIGVEFGLWKSDGTANGTVLVKAVCGPPGLAPQTPLNLLT